MQAALQVSQNDQDDICPAATKTPRIATNCRKTQQEPATNGSTRSLQCLTISQIFDPKPLTTKAHQPRDFAITSRHFGTARFAAVAWILVVVEVVLLEPGPTLPGAAQAPVS